MHGKPRPESGAGRQFDRDPFSPRHFRIGLKIDLDVRLRIENAPRIIAPVLGFSRNDLGENGALLGILKGKWQYRCLGQRLEFVLIAAVQARLVLDHGQHVLVPLEARSDGQAVARIAAADAEQFPRAETGAAAAPAQLAAARVKRIFCYLREVIRFLVTQSVLEHLVLVERQVAPAAIRGIRLVARHSVHVPHGLLADVSSRHMAAGQRFLVGILEQHVLLLHPELVSAAPGIAQWPVVTIDMAVGSFPAGDDHGMPVSVVLEEIEKMRLAKQAAHQFEIALASLKPVLNTCDRNVRTAIDVVAKNMFDAIAVQRFAHHLPDVLSVEMAIAVG